MRRRFRHLRYALSCSGTLLSLWMPLTVVAGQYEVDYRVEVYGGWGPKRVQIRRATVEPQWVNVPGLQQGNCCPVAFFRPVGLTQGSGTATGKTFSGQTTAGKTATIQGYTQTDHPGEAVSLKLLVPTLGPVNDGIVARLVKLPVSGDVRLIFTQDFGIQPFLATDPTGYKTFPKQYGLRDFGYSLLEGVIPTPNLRTDRWLNYYDILLASPSKYGPPGTFDYEAIKIWDLLHGGGDPGRARIVFQTFVNFGTDSRGKPPADTLGKLKVGLFKKAWGSLSASYPCTRPPCLASSLVSLPVDEVNRYSAVTLTPTSALTVPARLSFKLAQSDMGKPLDLHDVDLIVKAVRRSDGKVVQGVTRVEDYHRSLSLVYTPGTDSPDSKGRETIRESRVYLNLDDALGTVYDLWFAVNYKNSSYLYTGVGPGQAIYKVQALGWENPYGPDVPSKSWHTYSDEWSRYAVGGADRGPLFDAYPVYEIFFKKPDAPVSATAKGTFWFQVMEPWRSQAQVVARAARKTDGKVVQGVATPWYESKVILEDVPGTEYTLSFVVKYQGREYPSDQIGPGNPIEKITRRETGQSWQEGESGWRHFTIGHDPENTHFDIQFQPTPKRMKTPLRPEKPR